MDARARRRLGMPERTVNADDYDRIEELIDFEDVAKAIREALSDLSEDQREALTLRVIDGRTLPGGRGGARGAPSRPRGLASAAG